MNDSHQQHSFAASGCIRLLAGRDYLFALHRILKNTIELILVFADPVEPSDIL